MGYEATILPFVVNGIIWALKRAFKFAGADPNADTWNGLIRLCAGAVGFLVALGYSAVQGAPATTATLASDAAVGFGAGGVGSIAVFHVATLGMAWATAQKARLTATAATAQGQITHIAGTVGFTDEQVQGLAQVIGNQLAPSLISRVMGYLGASATPPTPAQDSAVAAVDPAAADEVVQPVDPTPAVYANGQGPVPADLGTLDPTAAPSATS